MNSNIISKFLLLACLLAVTPLAGALAGIILAWLSIMRLSETGINLEMFAEGAAKDS